MGTFNDHDPTDVEKSLLEELPRLRRAAYRGRSAPYKDVVLKWAVERARAGHPRTVPFEEVRIELRDLLQPWKIGDSPPKPEDPWVALASSSWWELPDAADEGGISHTRGGLSELAYQRITASSGFFEKTVELLDELISRPPVDGERVPVLRMDRDDPQPPRERVEFIAIEEAHLEEYVVATEVQEQHRSRAEMELQKRYADYLSARGHKVMRQKITTAAGELLLTDLYDISTGTLIEVKSSTDRPTLRMALGQILDYARYVEHEALTILVPEAPLEEMIEMLKEHGVGISWPEDDGFHEQ